MQFDLAKIKTMVGLRQDLNPYIDDVFNRSDEEGDPPCLSDIMVAFNSGGLQIMEALEHRYLNDRDKPMDERFVWKLFVKRDEWGNEPFKGDVVMRRIQKVLNHKQFKPATASELSIDKMNGTYDEKWNKYNKYTIDDRGCISCEFQDASFFINCFGMHPRTGRGGPPLSMHLQEHSTEPVKAPNGQMLHVWYHRFMEMDKAAYAKLPKLSKRDKPRRGLAPLEDIAQYGKKQSSLGDTLAGIDVQ